MKSTIKVVNEPKFTLVIEMNNTERSELYQHLMTGNMNSIAYKLATTIDNTGIDLE